MNVKNKWKVGHDAVRTLNGTPLYLNVSEQRGAGFCPTGKRVFVRDRGAPGGVISGELCINHLGEHILCTIHPSLYATVAGSCTDLPHLASGAFTNIQPFKPLILSREVVEDVPIAI